MIKNNLFTLHVHLWNTDILIHRDFLITRETVRGYRVS